MQIRRAGSPTQTEFSSLFRLPVGMLLMSAALIVVGVGVQTGCQKTVFRPDDHRSQFDRYDRSRSQRAQPFLEDEFGRRTPNLSERLLERGD